MLQRLDNFIQEEIESPMLTKEIIERIKKSLIDASLANPEKSDYELIYGLKINLLLLRGLK
ncbi:MAG: hypothetical protein GF383_08500 [Candidatus Lokiarchaeota archaeon]|nr:hypothetical protein [Candidatus Lokiarchaeota archaeon]MBD3340412.1 hypothetical protein [Candidatus Lokiarchaeota archaeon]